MMKKIFAFLCLMVVSLVAQADLYDVANVPIMAEMSSAHEARQVALANGEAEAFWQLMNRMVSPEDISRLPGPQEISIADLVQTVSLSNEKTTMTKYMANLSVRFNPDKVQALLEEQQIPFLMASMPSTIVIPILKKRDMVLALEENNPVYEALKKQALSTELCETVLPVGDLEEVALAQKILQSDDVTNWMVFAKKYQVKRVLLLMILQQGAYLSVQADSIPIMPEIPDTIVFDVPDKGNIANAMPEIWKTLMKKQEKAWREVQTNDLEEPSALWVRVPIQGLTDWLYRQKQLDQATFLTRYSIRGFRPNEVLIQMVFKGRTETILSQLKMLGMIVKPTAVDGLWEMTRPLQMEGWR